MSILVSELDATIDDIAGTDLIALPDAALAERVARLIAARRRLDAEVNRTVGAADARALTCPD